MKIQEITSYLESLAPLSSQEGYDNSGFIVGNSQVELTQALICLDSTEEVVDEAIAKGCNLIIAHHPIVFKGLKKITGKNYVERVVLKCIKNDIALYAIHTNLDNYIFGVNAEIGKRLGLQKLRVLEPKQGVLNKLVVFVPSQYTSKVQQAIYAAGAGAIGEYKECSFKTEGTGSFSPLDRANPFIGKVGTAEEVTEDRVEVLVSSHVLRAVINAMLKAHPYEEVAYDIISLQNSNKYEGAGMMGELDHAMPTGEFLKMVKSVFNCGAIRHTKLIADEIRTVAFCGGAGSFLLGNAIQYKADIYITGDFKYHEFFDAEDKITIADIGHFESEQFTIDLLQNVLNAKFQAGDFVKTSVNTNPVHYF